VALDLPGGLGVAQRLLNFHLTPSRRLVGCDECKARGELVTQSLVGLLGLRGKKNPASAFSPGFHRELLDSF
jgi:hypothetical protein